MPVKKEREYRSVPLTEFRAEEHDEKFIVEGYASTWESYELYDGIFERIDPAAFAESDFSDCCFLYNHEGMVYARTRNGSLEVSTDDRGLKVRADLSLTSAARELWESIKAGLLDQMSFAFTVTDDEFDKATRTRVVKRIGKVFDVSAVSLPANPTTEISARAYCDGVIECERVEKLAAEMEEKRRAQIDRILSMLGD